MMAKIVLVVERNYPPISRSNLRIIKIADVLAKTHEVILVHSGQNSGIEKKIKLEGLNYKEKKGIFEFISRLKYAKKVAKYIIDNHPNVDYLIGWNFVPNYANYLVSKKLKKVKVICDMTDFGWDFFLATHPNVFWGPFVRWIEKMECLNFPKNAYKVVVVSEFMKMELNARYNIDLNKILVMPDGVESGFKSKISKKLVRSKLGLTSKNKVVVYLGDAEVYDGLDILYNAFKDLVKEIPEARLLVVGNGRKYFQRLKKVVLNSPIKEKVIYTGWVQRHEVPNFLNAGDVGVIPSRKRLSTDAIYTFRIFEYFNIGLPVVISNLETLKTIVTNKLGRITRAGDALALKNSLYDLLSTNFKPNKKDLKKLLKKFKWSSVLKAYSSLVK
ncbi:hypothetical protein DRJ17_03535 [Candidatus Woesearchaeota archaeon]|nr:MAG: hypothetical protein DRJ17_03535 [Candidatus Woesearchaeota archaeon]